MPAPLLALALAAGLANPILVEVDATDIPRRIVHARVVLPVQPGPLTLAYPKFIPGEHGPTGPLNGVVNMLPTVGGKPVAWRRDPLDAWLLHLDVPAGAKELEVRFDFVSQKGTGNWSGSVNGSENVGVLSFNHVVLSPLGMKGDDVVVRPRVKVPKGWELGGALEVVKKTGNVFDLETTSLTTLVDSPVNMGRYARKIDIGEGHVVSLVAESAAALEIPVDTITAWKQLVAETGAMFGGSRHYRRYVFLLTLSDLVDIVGLEHHESSDNRLWERAYLDDDRRPVLGFLLPHEMAHSWNGKFRRPVGLATADLSTPVNPEMLWVYEGLTEYLGWVLAARSGLHVQEEWAAERGMFSAEVTRRAGRAWRPLQDTASAAHQVYTSPQQWRDVRRGVDFYDESALLWLGVDVKIRELSGGARSLDDFLAAFFGGPGGKAEVKPYTFDELVAALHAVAPFDWRAFWRAALDTPGSPAALEALHASGWDIKLVDEAPAVFEGYEGAFKGRDLRFSIGLMLDAESGEIVDVMGGSPAWKAGITPGMTLLAVNGRKDSPEVMTAALQRAKTSRDPIELLVENAEHYRVAKVEYRGGPAFPLLVRDEKRPDVLTQILKPRTPHTPRSKKKE